ncbi:MAG: hypothetical protein HOO95_03670 [Gallionella sp.]|nr:hypothetical protein [Gallionella sp.]
MRFSYLSIKKYPFALITSDLAGVVGQPIRMASSYISLSKGDRYLQHQSVDGSTSSPRTDWIGVF